MTYSNKTFSVLDLYYQFMNRKKITLSEIELKYDKDLRTIQRYIDMIEKFINHIESNQGVPKEKLTKIKFEKKESAYVLYSEHLSVDTAAVLSVLIQMKSLTPFIAPEAIQLFQYLSQRLNMHERLLINQMLNRFNKDTEKFPEDLVPIQDAIDKRHRLTMELDTSDESWTKKDKETLHRVQPVSIVYQYYHYYLIFHHKGEVKSCKIIDIITFKSYPSEIKEIEITRPIVLEVTDDYYRSFKETYSMGKERFCPVEGKRRFEVKMSREDAFFLCFRIPEKLKIVEPIEYVNLFKSDMQRILNQYE
ncbi:YafY family protein [Macrococcus sp. DPC7161]|uniref:helix-turn-helix transcriptional regulator n=1 Tax=Macrococcus sp. DPC7161 TaxID=2507060 RepID=UPI00100B595F|nr:WYL domain-containing protein [Macrococcus sp. DPC7161]RXK17884.1 hypothetical protein ER639_06805 [Macrococcus sp. DPC7161]